MKIILWFLNTHVLFISFSLCTRICKNVEVWNSVDEYENRLRGCEIIVGYLKILLIENASIEDYKNVTFPELLEIKGYLLIYRVYGVTTLSHLFPNLTIIRGNVLFTDYSLVLYDMLNLQEIGLTKLQYIARGSTRIEKCPQLCYVNTVDWTMIGSPSHDLHYFNTNEDTCDMCPDECNGRCWNQNECQLTLKDSCNTECIGCKGNTNQDCILCKNYKDGDKCVSKCKKNKVMYTELGTCISRNECLKLPHGPWWPFKEECVNSCPTGYNKITNHGGCQLCLDCPKHCSGIEVDSIASAEMLLGCTHINGTLSIRVDSKNTADELDRCLGMIQEISGFLKIYRSNVLASLECLKNLRVIHGEQLYNNRYAFVVYENQNLHKLWNWKTMKIKNGTLLFHYNSHLCPSEIETLVKLSNLTYSTFDVSPYSNGDKRACNNITLNISIVELNSTSIVLEWDEYATDNNSTYIIGYLVYYIEDNFQNITVFDERDECIINSWYSKFVSNATVKIENLNAYSYYAYYIKTYATIPVLGGQTGIMYFMTSSDDPSNPYNLNTISLSSDSITITWKPPIFSNGLLNHYEVIAYLETDDPKFISRRDYCRHPHRLQRVETITTPPLKLPELNVTCCKDPTAVVPDTTFHSICNVWNFKNSQKFCENYMSYSVVDTTENPDDGLSVVLMKDKQRKLEKRSEKPANVVEDTISNPDATSYVFTGLRHFSMYVILLKACNNKMKCSGPVMISQRTLMNKDADDIPLMTVQIDSDTAIIKWEEPRDPNAVTVAYYVEHKRTDLENAVPYSECITQDDYVSYKYSYKIKNLLPGTYSVRVKSVSLAGEGSFSAIKEFEISSFSSATLTAVLITLSFVVIIVGIVGCCYYYYKRNNNVDRLRLLAKANSDRTGSDYIPDEWELKRDDIEVQNELGQGTFGMVYNGLIKSQNLPCAVKTINTDADDSDRTFFLNEGSVMKSFSNAYHVVKLLGVVSRGNPPLVVMELMARGDLKTFLRQSRNASAAITCAEMYRMAAEIADGMMYLSAKKFIHRDLAARNCMVAADRTVKIGDFGMARDVYYTDYYKKDTGGLMPIRWMSPESLADGVFTVESDVWSYGVVLWEIATFAEQPYQGLANEQVFQFVTAQGTLERPLECSDLLYDIMEVCWKWKPKDRPRFQNIIQKLEAHVGQHFQLVSFYHSFDGEQYLIHAQERTYSPSTLMTHLNKNDGVYWDACYDDVDLNIG